MSWFDELGNVLGRYEGGQQAHPQVDRDFDEVAQVAPQNSIAGGLAEAFRSDATPPFPQMLGGLFGKSDGNQRAGLLNTILGTVGPALLSQILSRHGRGGMDWLNSGGQLTAEQAQEIPLDIVEEVAAEAEKRDPSIVDRASDFYAAHPKLVQNVGAGALAILLASLANKQRRS